MSDFERMLRGEITAREYTERVAMEARRQESLDYYRQRRRRRSDALYRMVALRAKKWMGRA